MLHRPSPHFVNPESSWIWRGYLHPWPVAALIVLVVNDHILKGSAFAPGWLTGKLSDFAGLFLFPLLLGALAFIAHRATTGVGALTPKALAAATALTGIGFAGLQLVPIVADGWYAWTELLASSLGSVWRAEASVTMDPTDLVALPVLVLAWLHGRRFLTPPEPRCTLERRGLPNRAQTQSPAHR